MIRRFAWVAGLVSLAGGSALGGTVVYTDLDLFRAAAGDVRVIDFETLPDGTPSQSGVLITPEFNYTAQGGTFAAQAPRLRITGNEITGFNLGAVPILSNDPTRNWILAHLAEPAYAVGVRFPGTASLILLDVNRETMGRWTFGGGGQGFFLGVLSDDPIYTALVDHGSNSTHIHDFWFASIPEPATLVLLALGGGGRASVFVVAGGLWVSMLAQRLC